jgi:hypothetical protein
MAMTSCRECGTEISTKAEFCPKCGTKMKSGGLLFMGCLGITAVFLFLAAIGLMLGDGESTPKPPSARSAPDAEVVVDAEPSDNLTAAQRNATRSAQAYLRVSGFSRQGLIDQLSSEFGDQYRVEDATVAVDNLNVDWNAQAARSAAAYLRISGFSCQGLIDQLSSDFGDKYTEAQARHGAREAGAC